MNMLFLCKKIFPFPLRVDQNIDDFFYNRGKLFVVLPLFKLIVWREMETARKVETGRKDGDAKEDEECNS
jgi:hypothetical protein